MDTCGTEEPDEGKPHVRVCVQRLALVASVRGTMVPNYRDDAFRVFALGLGLPTVGVYIIMATLIAPALVKVGVEPMAAHMFLLYFGIMSMVTPPVGHANPAGKCQENPARHLPHALARPIAKVPVHGASCLASKRQS